MELEHSFTVPVPKSRAWDVLLDVERVAPCMPGATLDSVDGDEIRGRIKVKVGPINMTYAGTARFVERDKDAGVVTLEASGKETRGAGTASASVRSVLVDRGQETDVKVLTTLNVTGKPAQFGRGVMNEVGGRLLTIFATTVGQLAAKTEDELLAIDGIGPASVEEIKAKLTDLGLTPGQPLPAAAAAPAPVAATQAADGAAAPAATAGTAPVVPHPSTAREVLHKAEDDAINLLRVAGLPVLKRAIPVLAGLAAALLIGLRRKAARRRSR